MANPILDAIIKYSCLTLPIVLQNNDIATNVLYAVKNMMTIDDPAIVIQWNDPGFNDVPTMPGCRNGIAEQTQNAIVTVFTTNRGIDVKGFNTVFYLEQTMILDNVPSSEWYSGRVCFCRCGA
ncbi:hypothetical protein RhiirA4_426930 [Rhizophagus irregularis]|uniref:Uncharacterized protein n=1 Tax=Rhizophagus irregularis TaxID=588596 RepID=A0A2I1H703_9GLOM|nr:hypothetical protein RhiirA4_426930 [Rhizophagus irregularis]